MSFDKAKVVRTAEKFLTQGKILPAITEYRKIVAADTDDFTALNMLGDLYVRVSKNAEAIECFARIANHYREQGFNLKAIAMLKKIDRLQPANPDIAYQLGTLYEAQGLAVEARAQYLVVADFYTAAGEVRKTLEILHRVADLDPHNVETRLKLAEGYIRENMPGPAGDAFTEAGRHLSTRGNYERALVAYKRALDIAPFDHEAWSGFVAAHTALNSADEAAAALRALGVLEAQDIELIALLAQAYLADENAPQAEAVVDVLLRLEPSSYTRMLDVARLYLKNNKLADCTRVLEPIVDPILNARADAALIYVLEETLARNPEHLPALHLLVRVHKWTHDEERLQKALERLADAADALSLPQEQYQALQQLQALVPHVEKYRRQLEALDHARQAAVAPPPITTVHADLPANEAAFYDNLAGLSADVATTTPMSAEMSFGPAASDPFAANHYETAPLSVSGPLSASFFEQSFATTQLDQSYGDNQLEETFIPNKADKSDTAGRLFGSNAARQVEQNFTPHNHLDQTFTPAPQENVGPWPDVFALPMIAPEVAPPPAPVEFAASQPAPEKPKSAPPVQETSASDVHPHQKILEQELESVDFYLAQGYYDIAQDTLDMLERQFGTHSGITQRRAQMPAQDTPETSPAQEFTEHLAEDVFASVPPAPINSTPPAETHAPAEVAPVTISPATFASDVTNDELFTPTLRPDEAIASLTVFEFSAPAAEPIAPVAAAPTAPNVVTQPPAAPRNSGIDAGLAAIFDEFRVAVEEESQLPADDDFETHYNLGLAYQEMELVDEAIEEFQIAVKLVPPSDGTSRYLHCCGLLGHCFTRKDLPRVAMMWFKKGLEVPNLSEEEDLAMRYELGLAYEQMGDHTKAVESFVEVYGVNVTYRGVSDKLRELREVMVHG